METKIRERRGITGAQVRRACIPDTYGYAGWETHRDHGHRLLVLADCDGVGMKVILEPVDVARYLAAANRDQEDAIISDEFDEFEVTEDEFDTRYTAAERVMIVPGQPREALNRLVPMPGQSADAGGSTISDSHLVPAGVHVGH